MALYVSEDELGHQPGSIHLATTAVEIVGTLRGAQLDVASDALRAVITRRREIVEAVTR